MIKEKQFYYLQWEDCQINQTQHQHLFAVLARKMLTRQWVWSQLKLLKIMKYLKLWKCCLQFNPISIMSSARAGSEIFFNNQRSGSLSSWFNWLSTIEISTLTEKSY